MTDDPSPHETPFWPDDLPKEERERLLLEMLEDEQGPRRISLKKVEEDLKRQRLRFDKVATDLELMGIRVSFPVWDCRPDMIDTSACTSRTRAIALLMYELGYIAAHYSHQDDCLRRLGRGVVPKGKAGAAQVKARSEKTHSGIRDAFAALLKKDSNAGARGILSLAKALHHSLTPSASEAAEKGYSESNIRKALRKLKDDILAISDRQDVRNLSGTNKLRAIVERGKDASGITWETARYFVFQHKRK